MKIGTDILLLRKLDIDRLIVFIRKHFAGAVHILILNIDGKKQYSERTLSYNI